MIKRFIKAFLPHQSRYYRDRLLRRVNERRLASCLEEVGVAAGRIVYLQSAFGSLGYYPNGPERFLRLLQRIVGPSGTVVMPSFPFGGAMEDFVATRPDFDARATPGRIGLLPEIARVQPGALRSCHPTHPVVAIGAAAGDIIAGHERCDSPQGEGSPFAKVVSEDALVLRLDTPAYPLCHRLQELVPWPNLFLDEPVALDCVDMQGRAQRVTTRVYRKRIPFVMYFPVSEATPPIAANIIDFPLVFPGREAALAAPGGKAALLETLLGYRARLAPRAEWRTARYNDATIDAFSARESMVFALAEATRTIQRYHAYYDLASLEAGLEQQRIVI